jgi:hypothetical protein
MTQGGGLGLLIPPGRAPRHGHDTDDLGRGGHDGGSVAAASRTDQIAM